MSHFAVLVLHEEDQPIAELLAPYDENIEVEPYIKQTKEEAIKELENIKYYDFQYIDEYTSEQEYKELAEDWFGHAPDENGNILSTYNPNSKWDWWMVGGRFSGLLPIIPSAVEGYHGADCVDNAFVRHVKWHVPLDKQEKQEYIKWWSINIEGAPGEKDVHFFYNPEYYKKRYRDAETYIKTKETFCCHAVVTPDGVWHEPSKMGWFACTDGNPFDELEWDLHFKERFIDTAEFDWVATIVDCHI